MRTDGYEENLVVRCTRKGGIKEQFELRKDSSKGEYVQGRYVFRQMDQGQRKQTSVLSAHREWKSFSLFHHRNMKQSQGQRRCHRFVPEKCLNDCVALLTSLETAKRAKMQMHQAGNFSLSLFSLDNVGMRSAKGFRAEPVVRGNSVLVSLTGVTQQTVFMFSLKINIKPKLFGEKCEQNWKGN